MKHLSIDATHPFIKEFGVKLEKFFGKKPDQSSYNQVIDLAREWYRYDIDITTTFNIRMSDEDYIMFALRWT